MENQELWVVGNGVEERDALRYGKCDKYDYLAAVCCGAVAGLVDIFLVGSPIDWTAGKGSVLGSWTDKQVDEAVMRFAGLCGWKKQAKNVPLQVQSAIWNREKVAGKWNRSRAGSSMGSRSIMTRTVPAKLIMRSGICHPKIIT